MTHHIVSRIPTLVRFLFGALFLFSGLNGFLQFAPQPPLEGEALSFISALAASGYIFPLVKGIEVVAGAALLLGRFVPLALTVLAPIVINIVLFHTVLAPALPLAAFLLGSEVYLAYVYRDAFRAVLRSESVVRQSRAVAPGAAVQQGA